MATERIHTKDGGVIRVDRGDDGKVTGMTIINPGSSGYGKGDTFSRNDSGGITHTDANGNQRTGTVNWNNGEGNPKGSTITWDKPNFSGMKFGQGTDDAYQQTRNQELSDFYSKNGNYSYDSIYNDLMKNEGFKNASAADQKATVNKILASANKASGGTVGMKFGNDAYGDTSYDINDRNKQLADIAKDRGYDSQDKLYSWLESNSEAFKNASDADKQNTINKIMAMNKWGIESQTEGPTEEEIAEETPAEDEDEEQSQEDRMAEMEQKRQDYIDQMQEAYERELRDREDYRKQFYNKNPNEDTINGANELEKTPALNQFSLAANKDDVNGDGRPQYVDPNESTAQSYLTPDRNVRQDVNNAGDQTVTTNVGLVNDGVTPEFKVYDVETPEGIINTANDAFRNIMNGEYGGDVGQQMFRAYLFARNRLTNYANKNGIQPGTPEWENLFRGLTENPLIQSLHNNMQQEGTDQQTE